MNPVIQLSKISKTFVLPHEKRDTLKENLIHILRKRSYENFHALEDVSFEVNKGEFIGIVGKNGSGKSTLLKIIGGIYKANEGDVKVSGSIAPFLELGIGFQPELTARENIIINATLMGLNRKQITERFQEIVDFAEIENFLDLKIKNYSSGMRARLAFAIAKEADADIYLCDEVLAVGDEAFQQKCIEVFKELKRKGKTIVLVSHNSDQIKALCTRAVLLDEGRIVMEDNPDKVIEAYHGRIAS
jgi:ABC-type polysaccharide/polyol phosphate transport system ATPase subunit